MAITNNFPFFGLQPDTIQLDLFFRLPLFGNMTFVQGIKGIQNIAYLETTGGLKAYNCLFTDCGITTTDTKEVTTCNYELKTQECIINLQQAYNQTGIFAESPGFNPPDLPDSNAFLNSWIQSNLNYVVQNISTIYWQSDTGGATTVCADGDLPLDSCDGFIVKAEADASVIDVTGVAITTSNLIAQLSAIYAAIPNILLVNKSTIPLVMFLPVELLSIVELVHYQNLVALTSNYFTGLERRGEDFYFMGIKMVFDNGLPVDAVSGVATIVTSFRDNFIFSTDLVSDWEQFRILNLSETTGDDVYRMMLSFRMGADYYWGKYVVLYN